LKIIKTNLYQNKRNKQVSVTLPKKYIEELRSNQTGKLPKKISLKIINPKGVKG